ncbi:MAG: tetratricopeptide repeat protein [Aphanothece sp. CMT-3BRIN-NPC111]|jgi:predicted O-linked N-acetylglucosamine transferase (SPINDLY family)|nr:tetratricopeptide repeat protein [Aphanothece sp. CMT-3BRIN-NPC111]
MDYQRFIEQLPQLYSNWGESSLRPKSDAFGAALDKVQGMTTANVMQLLNLAVECMEPDEVYCEVGCFHGATLIGALLNHPDKIAYAVDNFSEFDTSGENFEQLSANLSFFNLEQQVLFCNQDFEEFFFELREIQPRPKIGVYFYDGAHDYRSQLLGLLLVKDFLADKALIIVDDSNWSSVQQANWDFMAANPECQLLLDLPTTKNSVSRFWNGIHIFRWDVNQEADYTWLNFAEEFRNPPLIKALYNLLFEFEADYKKKALNSLYQEALALEISGQLLEAEQKYKEVLQWARNHVNAWHNLGMIYYEMERYQDALSMVLKSLELDPSIGLHYYSLGLVLEKIESTSQAIGAYEKAIQLNSQLVDAYNNLGNLLSTLGDIERAKSIYRQAIADHPNHFGSYLNLGNLLIAQHQIDEAIQVYQKALQSNIRHADIFHNLAVAFDILHDAAQSSLYFGYADSYQGKYESAIINYEKFLAKKTGDINFYITLADCYKNLNQESAAIKTYQNGLRHYPTAGELYFRLVTALQDFGRIQEAIAVANEALQLLPNDFTLKLEKARLLPIIYETSEEIDFYRSRFTQELEALIQETTLDSCEAINNAFAAIGRRTNFYLQYQGKNDLKLQTCYGQVFHQIMAAKYPEWAKPLTMPAAGEKLRIGYVSAYLRNHMGAKWALGWIKNHNREELEIYCYYTSHKQDSITQQFRRYSDAFHHLPEDLEAVCQQITADKLHIIVYPDIGMEPQTNLMAGLRLAPVQCTAWGHPVTSGLPTIDYYLSSELMEPENAEEHYSEKLIRLPNLGFSYAKPILTETRKTRLDFQLTDDAIVYLCCQSLFKYLPQYDYIFAEIARRVPQAKFAFIASHISGSVTEKFQQRLQKAFAAFGLSSEEYCLMFPRLNYIDYLHLNLVSDIFLDTFTWSGGNTTLEAIACNLPVVTCPGEFMRGRHSYGILKMLGVTETIAKNEAEYIEIAVRLGVDKEWRKSIVQQTMQNHDRLYDDKTCVEALEAFYQRVV